MFQNEIVILAISSSVLLVVLIALLGYLLLRKIVENRKREKVNEIKGKMNLLLYDFLVEGKVVRGLLPDTKIKKIALEELLLRYAEMFEGEEERQHLAQLADLHLRDYYCENLKSLLWSTRMNTLFHIEDLRMISLMPEVLSKLESRNPSKEEIILSLRILASFGYPEVYRLLQTKGKDLEEYDYRSILARLDAAHLQPFILQFHHCPPQLKFAILEVISINKDEKYCHFLESVYTSESGELRLRALKAIASIGHLVNLKPFMSLVKSSVWEERMLAARIFGIARDKEMIQFLIELLGDKVWWVRYQAGQALMMYPNGKEILREVFKTAQDPFTRDMASEWINKGESL